MQHEYCEKKHSKHRRCHKPEWRVRYGGHKGKIIGTETENQMNAQHELLK